jgi:hypothetical protein
VLRLELLTFVLLPMPECLNVRAVSLGMTPRATPDGITTCMLLLASWHAG